MSDPLFHIARSVLFALEAEKAHDASLRALELGLYPRARKDDPDSLTQQIWGLRFSNPLGIAAGYDKNARVPDALLAMGMGFAEVGTVTPRPQNGNPKPRVFRLPEAMAVINRLGFNNAGHAAALVRLDARRGHVGSGPVGVNIGANKDSEDRAADYVLGIETFGAVASYFMVNVSSPNTPGLRDLQAPEELKALLTRVLEARDRVSDNAGRRLPVVVKLAPDVAVDDLPAIVSCIVESGADGICVSNTTLTRPGVTGLRHGNEAGGLSGAPLFDLATMMLARVFLLTQRAVPLIGVGGIHSGASAVSKMEAGASLIQVYTGMVYRGPGLITEIKSALVDAVERAGAANIDALVGVRADEWAQKDFRV